MAIFQKYIPVKGSGATHISVRMDYDLGGMNYFTHQQKPRGYYVVVNPCERSTKNGITMESTRAFSGYRTTLYECPRRSKSREDKAKEIMNDILPALIDKVCAENSLTLMEKGE